MKTMEPKGPKMLPGDAGKGDKSLSWAGGHSVDKETTRSSPPQQLQIGGRAA